MKRIYETPRLYTRELTENDLPALSSMLGDERVMHAWEHAFSEQETRDWLHRNLQRYREHGHGFWALVCRETDEMIGQCGLTWQPFGELLVPEIGYMLQRAHWHKGYAIEAARGCKRHAFEVLGMREVYSIIRDTNIASMNVAIRNGMLVRGRFVKHYYHMDMLHYAFSVRNGADAQGMD